MVAQGIQFQFVIFHQVPQLLDVEGSKPGAAGNQYTFECLARRHLEFAVLLDGEVVRLPFLQLRKEQVHRALISFVIFSGFTGIDKVQKCDEVLFFLRGLVPDVANQRGIIEAFRFDPEIFRRFFAFALRVHNQGVHQL